ncbi:hypothetical protein [Leptothermofonsia sp. ETS-13]|uniref:hypothetical protein n=1 Tax=Leptothermofonsia sp. ETS-13 TaxID=3035696 RepID=UPI003B9F5A1F
MLDLIEFYHQKGLNCEPDVQVFLDETDLGFLASNLKNILQSMENGAERIRTVILALRIFTRLDELCIKQINIHENIYNKYACPAPAPSKFQK